MSRGDVGGQKTLRSYWRNYFEKTDALIWVVDATDRLRIRDCREELAGLLLEEASTEPNSSLGETDNRSDLWEQAFSFFRTRRMWRIVWIMKRSVVYCPLDNAERAFKG